jgi:hypothetical protein
MLPSNSSRILAGLNPTDLVLDVGGWAKPFARADWVLDIQPFETRGLYGGELSETERFGAETWVRRDICDREPWPFDDRQFDFVVCSQTLEDLRDPVWVCSELRRVAKAGYIEVPSRIEEQTYGVHGPWVGWSHHHWLIDTRPDSIEFVFKNRALEAWPDAQFPAGYCDSLPPERRIQAFWWDGEFESAERILFSRDEVRAYLVDFVEHHKGQQPRSKGGWLRRRPRFDRRS